MKQSRKETSVKGFWPESEEPRIYKSGRRGRFNSGGYQIVAGEDAINQESVVFWSQEVNVSRKKEEVVDCVECWWEIKLSTEKWPLDLATFDLNSGSTT